MMPVKLNNKEQRMNKPVEISRGNKWKPIAKLSNREWLKKDRIVSNKWKPIARDVRRKHCIVSNNRMQ